MQSRGLKVYFFIVLFSISSCIFLSSAAPARDQLVFAIHPYLPATELVTRFTPLVNYISREIGHPIRIRVSKTYEDLIILLGEDKVDFAYMGPASYVKMVMRYGQKSLLARMQVYGKSTFQGIIIVREDSELLMLRDLTGKRFAFGDPESTMSHLVPRYVLWKAGVNDDDLASYEFLKNHHNVALGVLSGEFDAGAVKEEVFYQYEQRGLRELMRTPPVAEYVFVASNEIPPEDVEKIRNSLYALNNSERGQRIFTSIKHSVTGIIPVKDEDYDNLRRMMKMLEKIGVR
jgi:phosphonate transport system substrate-binding protein